MFQRAQLKEAAKSQLKGRWGGPVLFTLIFIVINYAISFVAGYVPKIGNLIPTLLTGPLTIGVWMYYFKFIDSDTDVDIGFIFKGFGIFGKAVGICLWTMLWVVLWTLLFIIPGIVKSIAYSQGYFIIAENPNVKVTDALKISMRMTEGYKWEIFVMGLSFIGWALLCVLTVGIGFLWLSPYMNVTYVNMYRKLKELSLESGKCTLADFGIKEEVESLV